MGKEGSPKQRVEPELGRIIVYNYPTGKEGEHKQREGPHLSGLRVKILALAKREYANKKWSQNSMGF